MAAHMDEKGTGARISRPRFPLCEIREEYEGIFCVPTTVLYPERGDGW